MRPDVYLAIVVGIIVFAMAIASGVLLWAALGGVAVGLLALAILRIWQAALFIGGGTAAVITAVGIASWLSPGWYQAVL